MNNANSKFMSEEASFYLLKDGYGWCHGQRGLVRRFGPKSSREIHAQALKIRAGEEFKGSAVAAAGDFGADRLWV